MVLSDWVMAGVGLRVKEGWGRTLPRIAEKTLGSDLALAQHVLGLPTHLLPSRDPRDGEKPFFLPSPGEEQF